MRTASASTSSVNTKLTADEISGLRRLKAASTLIAQSAAGSQVHRTKPLNTSLASVKHPTHTNVSAQNHHSVHSKHMPTSRHEQLVKQTQKWVGQTFYGTLLKQMRESPFKSDIFDGGRGGQAYGAMYDQELAEHMSSGPGKQLVDSIVSRIELRQHRPPASGGKKEGGLNVPAYR